MKNEMSKPPMIKIKRPEMEEKNGDYIGIIRYFFLSDVESFGIGWPCNNLFHISLYIYCHFLIFHSNVTLSLESFPSGL